MDAMVDQATEQHVRMMQMQRALTAAEERLSCMRVDLEHLIVFAGVYLGSGASIALLHQKALEAGALVAQYRTTHEQFSNAVNSASQESR